MAVKDTVKRLLRGIPTEDDDHDDEEDSDQSDVLSADEEDWYGVCIRYVPGTCVNFCLPVHVPY